MTVFLLSAISFILSGFGLGGGILFIPLLNALLSYSYSDARILTIYAYIPAAIGTIVFSKSKFSDMKKIMYYVIIGMIFSILGSMISSKINSEFFSLIYGLFLVFFGINMLSRAFHNKKEKKRADLEKNI